MLSTSVIRELQKKMAIRYHLTPLGCCNKDGQTIVCTGQDVEKLKFLSIAHGKAKLCRCFGIQLSNSLKSQHEATIQPKNLLL